jgi:site-specific DNA recombinase
MTRAAIYCRISRDPEDRHEGVDRQREDCLAIAKRRGWTVTPERQYIDNDLSAAKGARKARRRYLDLLADIEAGKVDAVVIWAEDRLQRQLVELLEFLRVCEQAGVTKLASAGGEFDMSNPDQRMSLKLKALIAEAEIEKMRARMRRQRLGAAAKGESHSGGTREFGTVGRRQLRDPKTGSMVTVRIVSEAQAARERELIWEAGQRVLAGDSLRGIRLDWTRRGIRTATGKVFTNQSLRKLLLSPRLAGYRAHHGQIVRDTDGQRVRLIGEGGQPVEPILELAAWAAICGVLRDPARITNHRGGLPRHELSGLLFCGICGHRMYPRSRGEGFIYRCVPSRSAEWDEQAGERPTSCGKVSRDAARLEDLIHEALFRGVEEPKLAQLRKPAAEDADPTRPHVEAAAEITRDLDVLDGMLAEAELAERQGRKPQPSTATLRRKMTEREAERDRHQAAVSRLQGRRVAAAVPRNLRKLWPDLSLDRRRAILAAVIERIDVHPQAPLGPGGFDPAAVKVTWRDQGEAR